MFEEVLRTYAHPAAVADLDALERGGSGWKRYLEAFGTSCRDNCIQFAQQKTAAGDEAAKSNKKVDLKCPLVRGMIDMCGQKVLRLLEEVYGGLLDSLQTFGRPLPPKFLILAEHQARVAHMNSTYGMKILLRIKTNVFFVILPTVSERKRVCTQQRQIGQV